MPNSCSHKNRNAIFNSRSWDLKSHSRSPPGAMHVYIEGQFVSYYGVNPCYPALWWPTIEGIGGLVLARV